MALRRILSFGSVTICLVMMLSVIRTAHAATCAYPNGPVAGTMIINNNEYKSCSSLPGLTPPGYLWASLSGLPAGSPLSNTMYPGYCADLSGSILDNPLFGNIVYTAYFWSSLDPNLPTALKLAGGIDPIPWDKINYLINKYPNDSWLDIQAAIWDLVHGCTQAAGSLYECAPHRVAPYYFPYGTTDSNGPFGCPTTIPRVVDETQVQFLVMDAHTNGSGFIPQAGDKLAAVAEITDCTPSSTCDKYDPFQIVLLPTTCPKCSGSVGDFVWEDLNGNGLQDANEPGIPNVQVELTGTDSYGQNINLTAITDQNGKYQFSQLCAGQYSVSVNSATLPSDVTPTTWTSADGNDNNNIDSNNPDGTAVTITTDTSSNMTLDFGYVPVCSGSVGDFVWKDLNGNGMQDSGEQGIQGVKVILDGTDVYGQSITKTAITDGTGGYNFQGLCQGQYSITVDATTIPAGFVPTSPLSGNGDDLVAEDSNDPNGTSVNLPTDAYANPTVDFGYTPSCSGSVGDFVWKDLDKDGIQDSGEPGIQDVIIMLTGTNGYGQSVNMIITTDSAGKYNFQGLCRGAYTITVNPATVPAGWVPTAPLSASGNDNNPADSNNPAGTSLDLPNDGDANMTVDFGYVPSCTGSIGDFVWNDLNQDGTQNDGAASGLGNVQVRLTGLNVYGQPVDLVSTTTGSGLYQFTGLCQGAYTVAVDATTVPAGFVPTSPLSANGNDNIPNDSNQPIGTSVTLGNDSISNQTIDFGYVLQQISANCVVIDAAQGVAITPVTMVGSGGCGGPYTFTATGLPAGLTMSSSGTISGTPTVNGTFNYTVTVTDKCGNTGTVNCSVTVTVITTCSVQLDEQCAIIPAPPTQSFVCSDAKPIDQMTVIWNGTQTVWVKAYNRSISGTPIQTFGPIAPGGTVTFNRAGTGSYANDIYFEIFNNPAMTTKVGNSTFHLSCSDVDMNGSEDCRKAAGDGKGQSGYLNTWIFDGMAGNGQVLDCSPTPSVLNWQDSCELTPQANPTCATEGKPTSLTFKYVPADCSTNNNPQNGKYTCTGSTPVGTVSVTSTRAELTISPHLVAPGQEFRVSGSFGADTKFSIGTQTVNIHTSCSQVLEVGNIFASMQLVAFNGDTGGSQVKYRYIVKNNSTDTLTYNLIDRVDSTIVNQYLAQTLGVGATQTFENFIATLNATTTNVATVTGLVGLPPNQAICPASSDSVTVAVPPTPPCSLTTATAAPTTKDKKLMWTITNSGATTVTLNQATVTWPATNGYLTKVKLDGDNSWDGTINCVNGLCFANITADQFVSDVNKKSIKAGDSRVLALEFQNDAGTDLSKHSLVISFGTGCTLSYNGAPPTCQAGLTIGDYVWYDSNNNGIQDAGESPAAGVPLTLKALDGSTLATATTGPDGEYSFSNTSVCAGGTYLVEMTPPAGFGPAISNAPGSTTANDSNPNPSVVTLVANQNDLTIDFGLTEGINYCPTSPVSGLTGPVGSLFVRAYQSGETIPASAGFAWSGPNPWGKDVVIVRYDQSLQVNDNTYGTGSSWGHKFGDLVGSDMGQFAIYNNAGTKVLEFRIDYISASASAPSGYASLGVLGGEGRIVSGTGSWVLDATTSLDINLNDYGYCTGGATGNCKTAPAPLLVNSGPSPNSTFATTPQFSLINAYYAVIDAAAFGGLANFIDPASQVRLIDQHNSPQNVSSFNPTVCE